MLGGVWQYRQTADDISLNDDDDNESTDFTDDSALSTPLPSGDVAFFDPLSGPSEEAEPLAQYNKDSWLLSAPVSPPVNVEISNETEEQEELKKLQTEFLSCSLGEDGTLASHEATVSETDSVDQSEPQAVNPTSKSQTSTLDEFDPYLPRSRTPSGSKVICGKGDLPVSPVAGLETSFPAVNHRPEPATGSQSPNSVSSSPAHSHSTGSLKGTPSASPHQSPQKSKLVSLDMRDKADYIYQAAHQISLAQQCEANSNYHMAFNYYKKAVGIMLTGVQCKSCV